MFKMFGIGNLTKEPEKIITTSGAVACKFTVASSDIYTKEDGTKDVQFFTVITWNKTAENCLKFLTKGSKVAVSGKPQNRTYEAQDGSKRYVFELIAEQIEFLSAKKSEVAKEMAEQEPIEDSDLPF